MTLGGQLSTKVIGRILQSNDLVLRSLQFNGSPLIDAPTSWQYLIWKYEYDAKKTSLKKQKIYWLVTH